MIKKYYNFIKESKSESKKNKIFLQSEEYKNFINISFSEIELDLNDSIIDIGDMDHDFNFYPYISDSKGSLNINGDKLGYVLNIKIKQKDFNLKQWGNHLNNMINIHSIVNDTINRFSHNSKVLKENVFIDENKQINISITFITDLDLKKYEEVYNKWFKSYKNLEVDKDIINILIDYLDDEIYNLIPFGYDIEYELISVDNETKYILFYLTDGAYRLGEDIAMFYLNEDPNYYYTNIDIREMDISYGYIDEIVEEYLENLDQ